MRNWYCCLPLCKYFWDYELSQRSIAWVFYFSAPDLKFFGSISSLVASFSEIFSASNYLCFSTSLVGEGNFWQGTYETYFYQKRAGLYCCRYAVLNRSADAPEHRTNLQRRFRWPYRYRWRSQKSFLPCWRLSFSWTTLKEEKNVVLHSLPWTVSSKA